jgi:uncharacterized membrane protein YgdD (TMEM256/DUF423 family)
MAMVAAVGLLGVIAGAVVAYAAERFPAHIEAAHVEALETGAGMMLIAGLALTTYALPAVL